MYTLSLQASLSMLNRAEATLGVPLPEPVTHAAERGRHIATEAGKLRFDADALGAAVTAALDADRDPGTDEDVTRLLMIGQLAQHNIAQQVVGATDRKIQAAITEYAPDILDSWQPLVAEASKALTLAVKTLPAIDPTSAAGLTPEQAQIWARTRLALDTLDNIDQAWFALNNIARFAPVDLNAKPLRLAALSAAELDTLGRLATPWQLVKAGHTLALADGGEYRARAARVAADRAAEANRYEEARREQLKTIPEADRAKHSNVAAGAR